MPPVIYPRVHRQTDLPDDLRPEMQGGVSILPGREGEFGPDFVAGGSI